MKGDLELFNRLFRDNRGFIFNDILESVVIAVVLAVVIRYFIFQPFYIPSGSMEPTLMPGDKIIVNKFLYRFQPPKRGDVFVFKYPKDPTRDFIKRVIGLPGDTIEVRDSVLFINGKQQAEPWLPPALLFGSYPPTKVPPGSYFAMGDNRNNSEDSRVWGFVPEENIRGKAVVVFWPINRMELIKDLDDY